MAVHKHPRYFLPALAALAVLGLIVPFLTWHQTWFGRNLQDSEVERYLHDTERPRRVQHALSQISDRMLRGDEAVKRWYPAVAKLSGHETAEIRTTAAWVMGQDNRSEVFHRALLTVLRDPHPMVRRNAALSLVRFSDSSGRAELTRMLQPEAAKALVAGTISIRLESGQAVGSGSLLARIRTDAGEEREVRSPIPGEVDRVLVLDGARVAAGQTVALVNPGADQVWEALRGLYLVGGPEDLPDVERTGRMAGGSHPQLQRQAELTARAIRSRAEHEVSR